MASESQPRGHAAKFTTEVDEHGNLRVVFPDWRLVRGGGAEVALTPYECAELAMKLMHFSFYGQEMPDADK